MDEYTYREAYRRWAVEAALCRMRGEPEPAKPQRPKAASKPRRVPRSAKRAPKPAKRRGCPCRLSPGRCFRCEPLKKVPPQNYESPYGKGRWRSRVDGPPW